MATRQTATEPRTTSRRTVVVLVARLDRRIVPALRFAARLPHTDVRALHISWDPDETRQLAERWLQLDLSWLPLQIREVSGGSLLDTVRAAVAERAAAGGDMTVVLPEVEYPRWWHPLLHRSMARRIARALQGVEDVTTVIVPYFPDSRP